MASNDTTPPQLNLANPAEETSAEMRARMRARLIATSAAREVARAETEAQLQPIALMIQDHEDRIGSIEQFVQWARPLMERIAWWLTDTDTGDDAHGPVPQRSAFALIFAQLVSGLRTVVCAPFRVVGAILRFLLGILKAVLVNVFTWAAIVGIAVAVLVHFLTKEE